MWRLCDMTRGPPSCRRRHARGLPERGLQAGSHVPQGRTGGAGTARRGLPSAVLRHCSLGWPGSRARPDLTALSTCRSLWLNSGGDPPRSPPGPDTASRSCSPFTATASTAATASSTSRSAASSGRPQHLVRTRPWESQRSYPTARLHGSQRLHRPSDGHPSRPLCVRGFPARPADGPQTTSAPKRTARGRRARPRRLPRLRGPVEDAARRAVLPRGQAVVTSGDNSARASALTRARCR